MEPSITSKFIQPSCSTKPEVRIKSIVGNAELEINTTISATCYVRSGKEMIRSANNYYEDGSLENAYLLYMRFLIIFVDKIRTHPGYKSLPSAEKKSIKSVIDDVLAKTEVLKDELLAQFEIEYENYKTNTEILRKDQEESERKHKEELEREAKYQNNLAKLNKSIASIDISSTGRGTSALTNSHSATSNQSSIQADYPPKYSYSTLEEAELDRRLKSNENGTSSIPIPAFDRTAKPSRILSPMQDLRNVIIPSNLVPDFLKIAKTNTLANVETCGILAGKIIREVLVITHLIIPRQKGNADSCTTENEEQIFGYQDKFNLITIGWIHTHPTQTAFLSSVDLHTHYSYQLMMPEAIALVCAPAKNETGIFMLNPTFGMDTIGSCQASGFHPHSQTSNPIFQDASHAEYDPLRHATICDLRYQI